MVQNESILRMDTVSLLGKRSFDVDLRYVTIEKHENDLRRNQYYTICDEITKRKFVLIVDEYTHIDKKALNFLGNKRCILIIT